MPTPPEPRPPGARLRGSDGLRDAQASGPAPAKVAAAFVACAAVIAAVMWWRRPAAEPAPAAPAPSATASAAPRCEPLGEELVVGDRESAKVVAPEAFDGGAPDDEDPLAPFAAEIGRGVVLPSGFAVGVRHDTAQGAVALVARLGRDGKGGALVKLGRTRGDLDPPVVAAAGGRVLAAMLEPGPNGRSVRVAAVSGAEVAWGLTATEGDDESLALDLAVSEGRGAVVWDDVPRDRRSRVSLAILDAEKLGQVGAVVRFAEEDRDLDAPKVARRPGGFWVAWIAHGEAAEEPKGADAGPKAAAPKGAARKPPAAKARAGRAPGDVDEELGGERITAQWIEIVPVDLAGVPLGAPRAVTPRDGRVLAFDLAPLADGNALVAYTDGDTPSGSSGGRLSLAVARPSGTSEPRPVSEEELGTGAPTLAGGFLVVPSLAGPPFVADLDPAGAPVGPIQREPSLNRREVLAADAGALFVATLAGRQARLAVMRCGPPPPPPPAPAPSAEE